MQHALMNLIHNAIKYTPNGGTISVEVNATSSGRAVIEVRDTGPGIPAAHRDRIFDRFYRVDASRSREEGGVGLGLAIARWAVEANGGQIELASDGSAEACSESFYRLRMIHPRAGGDRQLPYELRRGDRKSHHREVGCGGLCLLCIPENSNPDFASSRRPVIVWPSCAEKSLRCQRISILRTFEALKELVTFE